MNFNYTLVRSKRKTLAISINGANQITVRVPLKTPLKRIESFVKEKTPWINKILLANQANLSRGEEIINYKKILIEGTPIPLFIGQNNSFNDSCVCLKNVKNCKTVLLSALQEKFLALFYSLSRATRIVANSISFKDYKSRWGCCSGKNEIIFNYKLLMLSKRLQIYVIIHELCHVIYHDHSKNFWSLVKKFNPDYKKDRAELKTYAFITKLY